MKRRSYSGSNNPKWRGGKPRCLVCKKILPSYESKRCRICHFKFYNGKNSYQWQEKPTYKAIHRWISRKFIKPNICDFCHKNPGFSIDGRNKLHWSNISKKYTRIRSDWYCLCVVCHSGFDRNWTKRKRNKLGYFI